jgi:hypothetical protein
MRLWPARTGCRGDRRQSEETALIRPRFDPGHSEAARGKVRDGQVANRRPFVSGVFVEEGWRMGSLFEELEAREVAARVRVEELEAELAGCPGSRKWPGRGWSGCASRGRQSRKCSRR